MLRVVKVYFNFVLLALFLKLSSFIPIIALVYMDSMLITTNVACCKGLF